MPGADAHHPLRRIAISRLRRVIRLIVISAIGWIIRLIVPIIIMLALVFVLVFFPVTMIMRMPVSIVIMVMGMPMTMMPPARFGRQRHRQNSTKQHNQYHVLKCSRFDFHNNLPRDDKQLRLYCVQHESKLNKQPGGISRFDCELIHIGTLLRLYISFCLIRLTADG